MWWRSSSLFCLSNASPRSTCFSKLKQKAGMSYCLERAAYIDFFVLFFSSPWNNTQISNLHFDGFSAWVAQKMDIIWKRYSCWSCSVLLFPRLYQLYNPDLLFLPVQSLYKRAKQTGDGWGYVPSLKDTTAPLHVVELLWPIFHLKHSESIWLSNMNSAGSCCEYLDDTSTRLCTKSRDMICNGSDLFCHSKS